MTARGIGALIVLVGTDVVSVVIWSPSVKTWLVLAGILISLWISRNTSFAIMAEIWSAILAGRAVMAWTPSVPWPGTLLPLLIVLPVAIWRRVAPGRLGLTLGTMRRLWGWITATAVLSAGALWVWLEHYPEWPLQVAFRFMPQTSGAGLLLLGILFSTANAAAEETVWRGLLQTLMTNAYSRPWLGIGIQAVSFGAVHYRGGIPNGAVGCGMATAYGLVLGYLRYRSQGLLAPWIAHVVADSIIFVMLVKLAGVG